MLPLTLDIWLFSEEAQEATRALISAFCHVCGARRGTPKLCPQEARDGSKILAHQWDNPCGHVDTLESLAKEIAYQCAGDDCTVMFSEVFYPYCGQECTSHAAKLAQADLQSVISRVEVFSEIVERSLATPEIRRQDRQIKDALMQADVAWSTVGILIDRHLESLGIPLAPAGDNGLHG